MSRSSKRKTMRKAAAQIDFRHESALRIIAKRTGLSVPLVAASMWCNCPSWCKLNWPAQRLRTEVDYMLMSLTLGGLRGLWDFYRRPMLPRECDGRLR